jgi:hypothetical protein
MRNEVTASLVGDPGSQGQADSTKNVGRRPRRGLLRSGLLALAALIALSVMLHYVWTATGSNEWKLVEDADGLKIYSMKSPGARVKKFKALFQVQATLPSVVKMLEDPDVCDDIGCRNSTVEYMSEQVSYHSFVMDPPFPFRSREFVAKQELTFDSASGMLVVDYIGTPDRTPPDACCYRVKHMRNIWRFTPIGNGTLDVEYIIDVDEGGAIPGFLLDTMRPQFMRSSLVKLQSILNREKYQDAEYAFLKSAT